MQLETLIFDPSACGFPKPHIPLLPTGLDGIALKATAAWAPAAHFRHYTRGRYALRETYHLAGIGPGSALLAPSYHCRTMLDPALALGGNVLLYPLQPDLSPEMAAIESLVANSPVPVKALLVTHFFGIPKPLEKLAAWCAAQSITLVEDCSHAFFTEQHCPPNIGKHGQFVVSSPYKFLPSPNGGLLYAQAADQLQDLQPRAPAWLDELRGLAHAWSYAAEHRRNRRRLAPPADITAPLPAAIDRRETAGCSPDYRAEEENFAPLRSARMLYRHPDIEHVARRRRDNYQRWVAATDNLPSCRPLFPALPDGCIPYMFPLRIDNPEQHFTRLKRIGMPIWRWDSIVASTCPIANDYRLRLLHLPCHQSISDAEMDWMIKAVTKVSAGETAPVVQ